MSKLIDSLTQETGLLENDLLRIIRTAPKRYKHYPIDKRDGKSKRWISQPSRELKAVQRALVDQYLSALPIHSAAAAYIRGKSIHDNAYRHSKNGPILKLDFKDFFHSLKAPDWAFYCRKNEVFEDQRDIDFSEKILFHYIPNYRHLRLAIGAPSSPLISNLLMHEFDEKVSDIVGLDHVTYSRYADDLTFSAPRTGHLNQVEKNIRKLLKGTIHPKLHLNDAKKTLATKKFRRSVTGLILTNDGKISLGRDRKRNISASIHHAMLEKKSAKEIQKIIGYLAFAQSAEPSFVKKMDKKYGPNLVKKLTDMSRSKLR